MKRSEELKQQADAIAAEIRALEQQRAALNRRINRLTDESRMLHSALHIARIRERQEEDENLYEADEMRASIFCIRITPMVHVRMIHLNTPSLLSNQNETPVQWVS